MEETNKTNKTNEEIEETKIEETKIELPTKKIKPYKRTKTIDLSPKPE